MRAFRRMLYGRSELNEPSRFLRDVAATQGTTIGMSPVRGSAVSGGSSQSSYGGGRGATWGSGWSSGGRERRRSDDEEVTVAFAGKGKKTLLAGFAKLRKLSK